ncbi:aquaporin [Chelatococcus albus]|uniref:aquaporin n=1 Tax=Chelatococcus albus TaxID=3047466 RepID=UPI0030EBFAFA
MAGVPPAHAMFDLPLLRLSPKPRTSPGQWLSEVVATAVLVLSILGAMRFRPPAVAAVVGLVVGAACWFTASTSFANPAVTLARTLTATFAGIRPSDAPVFLLAQLVGAAAAVALGALFFGDSGALPAERR